MNTPLIWYMAAGYGIPAGIEAHILHYATEMRNHGFDTKVVVFKRIPGGMREANGKIIRGNPPSVGKNDGMGKIARGDLLSVLLRRIKMIMGRMIGRVCGKGEERHRFLVALDERGIPIVSLEECAWGRIVLRMATLFVPWFLYILFVKRRWPALKAFKNWIIANARTVELRSRLKKEKPDVVHVFGRLQTDAWAVLPAKRTIFHEMMTGTMDPSWTDNELKDFKTFISRAARVFAPGNGVADNLRRDFGVTREITPIFTMAPDEVVDVEESRCLPTNAH